MLHDKKRQEMLEVVKPYIKHYAKAVGIWDGVASKVRCPCSLHHHTHKEYHADNNPSATFTADGKAIHCYVCDRTWDIVQIHCMVGHYFDWPGREFDDALDYLYDKYVNGWDKFNMLALETEHTPEPEPEPEPEHSNIDIRSLNQYRQRIFEAGEHLINQGIGVVLVQFNAVDSNKNKKPVYIEGICEHGFKSPIDNIDTFKQALTSSTVSNLFDCEVGLAMCTTNTDLVVLDFDVKKGKSGKETFGLLTDRLGELPITYSEETIGGGFHLYFRLPKGVAGIKRRQSVPVEGIDGDSGFDVLASTSYSICPPTNGYTSNDEYPVLNIDELKYLPDEWCSFLFGDSIGKEETKPEVDLDTTSQTTVPLSNQLEVEEYNGSGKLDRVIV